MVDIFNDYYFLCVCLMTKLADGSHDTVSKENNVWGAWILLCILSQLWMCKYCTGHYYTFNSRNTEVWQYLLGKFNTKLCEVLPWGSKVVSNNWYSLLQMWGDSCDVTTLISHSLNVLPWNLGEEKIAKMLFKDKIWIYSLSYIKGLKGVLMPFGLHIIFKCIWVKWNHVATWVNLFTVSRICSKNLNDTNCYLKQLNLKKCYPETNGCASL